MRKIVSTAVSGLKETVKIQHNSCQSEEGQNSGQNQNVKVGSPLFQCIVRPHKCERGCPQPNQCKSQWYEIKFFSKNDTTIDFSLPSLYSIL